MHGAGRVNSFLAVVESNCLWGGGIMLLPSQLAFHCQRHGLKSIDLERHLFWKQSVRLLLKQLHFV